MPITSEMGWTKLSPKELADYNLEKEIYTPLLCTLSKQPFDLYLGFPFLYNILYLTHIKLQSKLHT